MRKTTLVGLSAAIAFVMAISYGAAVRTTELAQQGLPGAALEPIDVMQIMRNAKDLPELHFDAI
jgi:hypothetical protein